MIIIERIDEFVEKHNLNHNWKSELKRVIFMDVVAITIGLSIGWFLL